MLAKKFLLIVGFSNEFFEILREKLEGKIKSLFAHLREILCLNITHYASIMLDS